MTSSTTTNSTILVRGGAWRGGYEQSMFTIWSALVAVFALALFASLASAALGVPTVIHGEALVPTRVGVPPCRGRPARFVGGRRLSDPRRCRRARGILADARRTTRTPWISSACRTWTTARWTTTLGENRRPACPLPSASSRPTSWRRCSLLLVAATLLLSSRDGLPPAAHLLPPALGKAVRVGEARHPGPAGDGLASQHAGFDQDAWVEEQRAAWTAHRLPDGAYLRHELEGPSIEENLPDLAHVDGQRRREPGRHLRLLATLGEDAWDHIVADVTAPPGAAPPSRWGHLGNAAVANDARRPRAGRRRPSAQRNALTLPLQVLIPPPVIEFDEQQLAAAGLTWNDEASPSPSCGDMPVSASQALQQRQQQLQRHQQQQQQQQRREPAAAALPTAGKRTAHNRPRGKGKASRALSAIITGNTQGQPQLKAAMQSLAQHDTEVVAMLLQEHHARGDKFADMQAAAKRTGWRIHGSHARIAECMPAAGTAVAVRASRAARTPAAGRVDCSPAASPGSLATLWADVAVPSGLLLVSVYLHDTEVGSQRNCDILAAAVASVRAHGGAWAMAGDFNCTPQQFLLHYQWMFDRVNAGVVASGCPTLYPGQGNPRELDYFVLPSMLLPYINKIERVDAPVLAPHRAVKLTFNTVQRPYMIQVAAAPRPFGREKPIGCAREPQPVPAPVLEGAYGATRSDPTPMVTAHQCTMQAVEAELCGVTDRFSGDQPDKRYCGRAQGLRLVSRPALPPRRMADFGKADTTVQALLWLEARLRELAHFSSMVARATGITRAQVAHFCKVMERFRRSSSMRQVLIDLDGTWAECWDLVARHLPGVHHDALRGWAEHARRQAARAKQKVAVAARNAWLSWVRAQLKGGAGALHKYAKRSEDALPPIIGAGAMLAASPQQIVDSDREAWARVWEKFAGVATAPWRTRELVERDILPVPSLEEMREAVMSFDVNSAVGFDAISPRWLRWLSDDLLGSIAVFLHSLERLGFWPNQLAAVMVCLIPKKAGGRRPIGIEATMVRLWEKVRRPVVATWRLKVQRPFDCMATGVPCEQAVFEQTVRDEALQHRGNVSATVLLDVVKAFEGVLLSHVYDAAVTLGFPMAVLRLALEACAALRYLSFERSVAKPVATLSAIIAGGTYATDFLAMVLIHPLDHVLSKYSGVIAYTVVDDVTLRAEGTEAAVHSDLAGATRELLDILEGDLGMVISRGAPWRPTEDTKSTVVVGDPSLRRRIGTSMRAVGFHVRRQAKNLGVDYAPLKRFGKRVVQQERRREAQTRRRRIRRLPAAAAVRLDRTGKQPAVMYGGLSTGIPPPLMRELRSDAGSAYGEIRGRSLTARLLARAADPARRYYRRLVTTWASLVWTKRMPMEVLRDAWVHAQATVATAADPYTATTGGTGVLVAALRQIGWKFPAPNVMVTIEGVTLDLAVLCPRTVVKYLDEDYETHALMNSLAARQMNDWTGEAGFPRTKPCAEVGAATTHATTSTTSSSTSSPSSTTAAATASASATTTSAASTGASATPSFCPSRSSPAPSPPLPLPRHLQQGRRGRARLPRRPSVEYLRVELRSGSRSRPSLSLTMEVALRALGIGRGSSRRTWKEARRQSGVQLLSGQRRRAYRPSTGSLYRGLRQLQRLRPNSGPGSRPPMPRPSRSLKAAGGPRGVVL